MYTGPPVNEERSIMPGVHVAGPNKLTFLHIAKNAGTAIGNWLIKCSPGNFDYWNDGPVASQLKPIYQDLGTSFVVVRNPWDRWVSFYHFHSNFVLPGRFTEQQYRQMAAHFQVHDPADPIETVFDKLNQAFRKQFLVVNNYQDQWPPFDQWLISYRDGDFRLPPLIEGRGKKLFLSGQQLPYTLGVDRVLRFENLAQEIQQIQSLLAINDVPLSTANTSKHLQYREYYTPDLKDMVYKWNYDDIKAWGYEF